MVEGNKHTQTRARAHTHTHTHTHDSTKSTEFSILHTNLPNFSVNQ